MDTFSTKLFSVVFLIDALIRQLLPFKWQNAKEATAAWRESLLGKCMKHQWPWDRKLEMVPRVCHHQWSWLLTLQTLERSPSMLCPRTLQLAMLPTGSYQLKWLSKEPRNTNSCHGVMFRPLWFHQTIYSSLAAVLRQFNWLLRVALFNCALASSWRREVIPKPLL